MSCARLAHGMSACNPLPVPPSRQKQARRRCARRARAWRPGGGGRGLHAPTWPRLWCKSACSLRPPTWLPRSLYLLLITPACPRRVCFHSCVTQ